MSQCVGHRSYHLCVIVKSRRPFIDSDSIYVSHSCPLIMHTCLCPNLVSQDEAHRPTYCLNDRSVCMSYTALSKRLTNWPDALVCAFKANQNHQMHHNAESVRVAVIFRRRIVANLSTMGTRCINPRSGHRTAHFHLTAACSSTYCESRCISSSGILGPKVHLPCNPQKCRAVGIAGKPPNMF